MYLLRCVAVGMALSTTPLTHALPRPRPPSVTPCHSTAHPLLHTAMVSSQAPATQALTVSALRALYLL